MKLDIRTITDTAHPQTIVPIYFIHTIQQPFCSLSGCWCQANKAQITKVLLAVQAGEWLLAEAVNLNSDQEESKE